MKLSLAGSQQDSSLFKSLVEIWQILIILIMTQDMMSDVSS